LGNYKKAIQCYEKTLEVDPHNVDALQGKGFSSYSLQQKEFEEHFVKAQELESSLIV
jgi:tetratricopeptide (TPR) repeat protein